MSNHDVKFFTSSARGVGQLALRLAPLVALVLIHERTIISRTLLAKLPNLKLISQAGKVVGQIDVEAATDHGVAIAEGVGDRTAPAELTWALIMAASRRIGPYAANLRADAWQVASTALAACRTWGVESENQSQRGQFLPDLQAPSSAMGQKNGEKWGAAADLQPTTPKSDRLLELNTLGRALKGRTLWIWGYGRIDRLVAGYGRAFGMRVLVWASEASRQTAQSDGCVAALSKQALFGESDVLSLHLQLNAATRGIVGADDLP